MARARRRSFIPRALGGDRRRPADPFAVAGAYLVHGIDHILLGYDHLLFVLALILIVPQRAGADCDRDRLHGRALDHACACDAWRRARARTAGRSDHRAEHSSARLRDRAHKRRPTEPHGEVAVGGGILVRTSARLRICECAFGNWTCRAATFHSHYSRSISASRSDNSSSLPRCSRCLHLARRIPLPESHDATGSTGRDIRDRHTGRVLVRRSCRGILDLNFRARRARWPTIHASSRAASRDC